MPNSIPSAAKSEDTLFRSTTAHELAGRTNKSPEAIAREYERDLIGNPPAPCIKGWTEEQILHHANTCGDGGALFNVEVPQAVRDILANPNLRFPLTDQITINALEDLVADHNGVPCDKIVADGTISSRGHQWEFYPETAPILTGFDYLVSPIRPIAKLPPLCHAGGMNVRRAPRPNLPPDRPGHPVDNSENGAKVKWSDFLPSSPIPKWMITKEGLIQRKPFEGPRTRLEAKEDLSRSIFVHSIILLLLVPLAYSSFTTKPTIIAGYILSIFIFLCLRAVYKRYRISRDWQD